MNKAVKNEEAVFAYESHNKCQEFIRQNDSPFLFAVRLNNYFNVINLYQFEYANKVKLDLCKYLEESYNIVVLNIKKEYLLLLVNLKEEQCHEFATKIHRSIQMFPIAVKLDRPLFLKSSLASKKLKAEDNLYAIFDSLTLRLSQVSSNENCYYFSSQELDQKLHSSSNEMILANSLQSAIANKNLSLAFQPIVDSRTGAIYHYEALLRLKNNEQKIISAGPFIPVSENLGFIDLIDFTVLDLVAIELLNYPDLNLSFNLSAMGIINVAWLDKLRNLLETHPSLKERIIIEITETALQTDITKVAYFMAALQELGCNLALDDFGAGYTSFQQLRSLSADIIKIDGSYIRDIARHSEHRILVKSIIEIGQSIGAKIIAEFVESGEIAKILMDLGVDYLQGNYFLPAVNYRPWENKI